MKKTVYRKILLLALAFGFGVSFLSFDTTFADDGEMGGQEDLGTSISLSPVSTVLDISSNSQYEDSIEVKNNGKDKIEIEVYAAPYSYVYSENEDAYKLGFSNENNFTQITRWITFQDSGNSWVKKANYTVEPGDTLVVRYRISTPDNIPAGGQYAVIFAHTLTSSVNVSGIRTEASPGMILYGRSNEGEVLVSAEISQMELGQISHGDNEADGFTSANETEAGAFYGSAKVKNNGNVDFNAKGKLKVEAIIGSGGYETDSNSAIISVIPESELVVFDQWEETPSFGIYKATWTVTAGKETETVEKIIFVNPLLSITIIIILLTAIIVCIIIAVRKRKERRSRLAV